MHGSHLMRPPFLQDDPLFVLLCVNRPILDPSLAEKAFTDEVVYILGSGYCLGKLGRHEDSVKKHRRADALEPNNYKHLNDLGYALFEAGKFDEAEKMLEKSISLAPPDYEFPRNNLVELQKRRAEEEITD
jgi:Flp pilus assembly protein TadD